MPAGNPPRRRAGRAKNGRAASSFREIGFVATRNVSQSNPSIVGRPNHSTTARFLHQGHPPCGSYYRRSKHRFERLSQLPVGFCRLVLRFPGASAEGTQRVHSTRATLMGLGACYFRESLSFFLPQRWSRSNLLRPGLLRRLLRNLHHLFSKLKPCCVRGRSLKQN